MDEGEEAEEGEKLMTVFKHSTHWVYRITKKLVLIRNNGRSHVHWRALWLPRNWRFRLYIRRGQWFLFVRLPFLLIKKNNGGFSIGTQNHYAWFIFGV
jgi:hypothetical protein